MKKHLSSTAQAKYGHDIARSIYYRKDFRQPWQEVKKTITRLQRFAMHKRDSYPVRWLNLRAASQHHASARPVLRDQTTSPVPASTAPLRYAALSVTVAVAAIR